MYIFKTTTIAHIKASKLNNNHLITNNLIDIFIYINI